MDKQEKINVIGDQIKNCEKCSLYRARNNPVIGQGSLDSKIMFIGEAPGAEEDRTGNPFCGASGRVLDELLDSIGIKREGVYIANILKCRPPSNRDPLKDEINICVPYLEKQIDIIKPEVICPLGRFSMVFIMEKFGLKEQIEQISKTHGRVFEAKTLFNKITIIPFYHPAVVTYNINMKDELKKDFKVLEQFK